MGIDFKACMTPCGRILNINETDRGGRGSSGSLGLKKQTALSSLYYPINYRFEVTKIDVSETPKEHGAKVIDLSQDVEFPTLDGDPAINDIIYKCWHNKYATVADLATQTKTLLTEGANEEGANSELISVTERRAVIGRIIRGYGAASGTSGCWGDRAPTAKQQTLS